MIIPIQRKIGRNKKENVKDEQKLVFEREKEKYKGLLLRIFAIGIKKDSIIVTQRRFNTLVLFSLIWYYFQLHNIFDTNYRYF